MSLYILVVLFLVSLSCNNTEFFIQKNSIYTNLFNEAYAGLIVEDTAGVNTTSSSGNLEINHTLFLEPVSQANATAIPGAIFYNKDEHYPLYRDDEGWKPFSGTKLGVESEDSFRRIQSFPNANDYFGDYQSIRDRNQNSDYVGASSQCPDGEVLTGIGIKVGGNCGSICGDRIDVQYIKAICRPLE